jgi:ParB-like chromosome segregation protein Spo0J
MKQKIIKEAKVLFDKLTSLEEIDLIDTLNELRQILYTYSPFKKEPIDCVQWIISDNIEANDYNPNVVAPPEMLLLEQSIKADGYTQPLVVWKKKKNKYEVVDGFHRTRVGKECNVINKRIKNYLPVSIINTERTDRQDRIAATIRHNRARGRHKVESMSDIVLELKNRNWTNARIAKELGMDQDEILRLCQITGLTELFSDQEFSKSWDIEGDFDEHDFDMLSDDVQEYIDEVSHLRVGNVDDENRIFHTWDKWECYKAGFYATSKDGMTKQECEQAYCNFLSNKKLFAETLEKIITEWKNSCEHYLTNTSLNRIAWLGQAAMCYATGVPAKFRSGFYLLSKEQQEEANKIALNYLNKWLKINNYKEATIEEGLSVVNGHIRQSELY